MVVGAINSSHQTQQAMVVLIRRRAAIDGAASNK